MRAYSMHGDKFHDECAVVGVYGHPEAATLTYLGLYALQHRGQESTGIVASRGQYIHAEVGMGRVNDFFTEQRLARLPGHLAIGHNRYSTTGSSVLRNAQPLLVDYARGSLAIAHNGNLVNAQRLLAEGYVIASETCALDLIEATYVRDVAPGELIRISAAGLQSYFPFPPVPSSQCIFELIYFARPDSDIFGHNVHLIRKAFGRQLAREAPVEADIVIPVLDSGIPAALGYAEESGIPFDTGLIRNNYVGRTFIEPQQAIRHFGVKIKLNAIKSFLRDKRVVVVDDSIVRGTTSQKLVHMIRQAGAKEVHMRISSPPTTHPCLYGIDTPTPDELIAARHTLEEIRDYIRADSLAYLSHEGMMRVAHAEAQSYCSACF